MLRFAVLLVLLLAASPAAAQDGPCTHDDALARAAAELVLEADGLSPDALLRVARRAGSQAPSVHALRVRSEERAATWLAELRDRVDAPLSCGRAQTENGTLMLAGPAGGRLEWSGGDRVSVSLIGSYAEPALVVRSANGTLHHLPVRGETVRLPEELELPAVVQLVAAGASGPRPIAERVLGNEDDARLRPVIGGTNLMERVTALRRRDIGGPLRDNRLLVEAAEDHAHNVCVTGRVAHRDESGSDPESRLRDRGVSARVVGEVVARGVSPAAAMDALFRSPSHQLALSDRRFTDIGLGSAEDSQGRSCVVVLLAAWPRFVGR